MLQRWNEKLDELLERMFSEPSERMDPREWILFGAVILLIILISLFV